MSFDHTVDVLVVGSGGGALTSAIAAQDRNANVLVVEKSNQYGGTSAMSGGSIWIPNSHLSTVAGGEDSREAALEYILTSVGDRADRKRIEAYVDFGPRMLKFLEENTHVIFECQPYSDYYPEANIWFGQLSEVSVEDMYKIAMQARRQRARFLARVRKQASFFRHDPKGIFSSFLF